MKIIFLFLAILTFNASAFSQGAVTKTPMLRHVVIFKFKDSSSAEDVQKVADTFAALYGKVPQVKSF